jgi:hypothetical protein
MLCIVEEKVESAGESLVCAAYNGGRAWGEEVSSPCQAHVIKLS